MIFDRIRQWWNKPVLQCMAMEGLHQAERIASLRTDIAIMSRTLGMIIAKTYPTFVVPEDDPARKAASDAIGEAVIQKLRGEYEATKHLRP